MVQDNNTYSPPILYKNTRTGLLFIIISYIILILTNFFLFITEWYEVLPTLIFIGIGGILYILGILEILSDSSFYDKQQHDRINNAMIFILIGFIVSWLFDSLSGVLSAIALGLLIYNWVPKNQKYLIITGIIISMLVAIFKYNAITYDYNTEPRTTFYHPGYYIAGILSLLINIVFLYVYLKLYRSVKPMAIPLYPVYQQPPSIQQRKSIDKSMDVSNVKLCPFCNGELEPEWRICHHCKKVLKNK